jgi:hypothetical protein
MSIDVFEPRGGVGGIRQSNREASQTRDLSGRKERDPFARLARVPSASLGTGSSARKVRAPQDDKELWNPTLAQRTR